MLCPESIETIKRRRAQIIYNFVNTYYVKGLLIMLGIESIKRRMDEFFSNFVCMYSVKGLVKMLRSKIIIPRKIQTF